MRTTDEPKHAPNRPARGFAALAFPLLVWFCASYFYFGEIGKYSDDWAINYRVYGTGAIDLGSHHPFERWNYFWRPLHLVLTCGLQTLFWEQDWLIHGVNAVMHGLVAWLLWRFLREVGIGRRIAATAALVMLVHPAVYEVVGWTSTVSTSIATAMLLGIWRRTAAWASGGRAWRGWRSVWWLGPVTFVMACFYEQQAGAACLLPVLYWTLCERDPRKPTAMKRFQRAGAIGIGPVVACVAYVALLVSTAPKHLRGGVGSFQSAEDIPGRLELALWTCGEWIVGSRAWDFARGGFEQGWVALAEDGGVWGGLVMGLLVVAGVVWVGVWWRRASASDAPTPKDADGRMWMVTFGLVVFAGLSIALALLPSAAATRVPPQARLIYLPLVCVIVACAAVCTDIARMLARSRPLHRTSFALRGVPIAVVTAVVALCVVQIGSQSAYRLRSRADFDLGRQLRELVPNPPEGTTFVPVQFRHRTVQTGSPRFNNAVPSALTLPWSAWAWVRRGYDRGDIVATNLRPGLASPFAEVTPEGFRYVSRWGGARGQVRGGGWRVEWARTVPFVVIPSGEVLVARTVLAPAANDPKKRTAIPIPLVRGLIESGALDERRTVEVPVP